MTSTITALRRYPGVQPPNPAEAREHAVRRRVNAAWGLLYFNTMTFVAGYSVLGIPSKVGKGVAQGALPLAILLLLTVNPKLKVRPNVFLCIVSLLVADAVITGMLRASPGHPVPDLPARRVLGRALAADAVLGSARHAASAVSSSLALRGARLGRPRPPVSPGRAFSYGGRLTGAIWPMLPTQIAQYAAVAVGLMIVLWLGRMLSGRITLTGVVVALVSFSSRIRGPRW